MDVGDPDLRARFLDGMSRAAATVNVVTTDGPSGRAGVTVSAMSSVSADGAAPTMLVCVHHQSSAAPAILGNGVFCVNVLREDQSFVSDTFAGRLEAPEGDRFGCTDWMAMSTGAPRVVDPLVAFDCEVLSSERVGTHYVLVGEVRDVFTATGGRPLIFARRNYGASVRLIPARDTTGSPREFLRLGALHTFGPSIVPGFLKRMADTDGSVDLDIYEGDQRKLLELLRAGEIDLALIYELDLGDDLATTQLTELPAYVLLPDGHPLAAQDSIALADLAPLPLVLLDAPPSGDYFLSLFDAAGLTPKVAYRPWGLEMARGMVANGLGYSLLGTVPASDVSYDGLPVVVRPLADDLPASRVVLAKKAGANLPGAALKFEAVCREGFNKVANGG